MRLRILAAAILAATFAAPVAAAEAVFRAGAAEVDISPRHFPVLISGSFLSRQAEATTFPLFARALVLDDGSTRLALVVVDTLFMPRELIDAAKRQAAEQTGIPAERILVAATHTHSAPSVAGALGTEADPHYTPLLPAWIAASIAKAAAALAPAEAGWIVVADAEHTHCRRWILRPDRLRYDPFGLATVRAQMHPGYQNADFLGPAGPVDAALSILSVRHRGGGPLAVLANYSMHYVGDRPVAPDYFGRFARRIADSLANGKQRPVVMMSQGTSGDQHWMDYARPPQKADVETYARELADVALAALGRIVHRLPQGVAMAERRLELGRRTPDPRRLAWARALLAATGDRPPQSIPEVYAREQLLLAAEPRRELVLQAVRVGEVAIAAIPNEVFAITGLKLKAQSPLAATFCIELANGCEGYIPPPEQHALGGYTTWPARSAGLETSAEPQIVDALLGLLEKVTGRPRRRAVADRTRYAEAVLKSKPAGYWRLDDFEGNLPAEAGGGNAPAVVEGLAAWQLDGASPPGLTSSNRALHLAGGRLRVGGAAIGQFYSMELWFCNLLPSDARAVTGCLVSRGADEVLRPGGGDSVALVGGDARACRLVYRSGDEPAAVVAEGTTAVEPGRWRHLVLTRAEGRVCVYLDGRAEPEIAIAAPARYRAGRDALFFGGRADNLFNLEGKIDEAALYDRALSAGEIAAHYAAAVNDGQRP